MWGGEGAEGSGWLLPASRPSPIATEEEGCRAEQVDGTGGGPPQAIGLTGLWGDRITRHCWVLVNPDPQPQVEETGWHNLLASDWLFTKPQDQRQRNIMMS